MGDTPRGRWAVGAPPPGGRHLASLVDTDVTWELWLRKVNRMRHNQIWYQCKVIVSPDSGPRRKANFWLSYDGINGTFGNSRDVHILRDHVESTRDLPGGGEDIVAWAKGTLDALHQSGDDLRDVPHVNNYRGDPGVTTPRPKGPGTKHMTRKEYEARQRLEDLM